MLQTSVQQLMLSQPGEVRTSMQEPLLQICAAAGVAAHSAAAIGRKARRSTLE